MEESREINEVSEKIEQFYRDATADDVVRVMKGETVEARFRNEDSQEWQDEPFTGWTKTDHTDDSVWSGSLGISYRFCQVYDPPEILKNKPDPGKGYRLLEKFPPEDLQEGDEAWGNYQDNEWGKSDYAERGCRYQSEKLWYRRRIANNPEIPDSSNSSETPNSSRSRNTIPSGWRVLGKDEERLASDAYWPLSAKDWIVIGDDRVAIANELPRWHAIRRVTSTKELTLTEGYIYALPSGDHIRITAQGFEVV
jgi:hypothetical protein